MNQATDQSGVSLFVDRVEDDVAVVLVQEVPYRLSRVLLPPGAKEGSWLRLVLDPGNSTGQDIKDARARLLESDPGGDIKL